MITMLVDSVGLGGPGDDKRSRRLRIRREGVYAQANFAVADGVSRLYFWKKELI